jgi:hypothetical protein
MSMSTVARGARKLKTLVDDQIEIPSPEKLLARKADEIATLKQKLAALVSRQLKTEANQQRRAGDVDPIAAEKRLLKVKIERLCDEAATLKSQFALPPKLSPQQQFWSDALKYDDVYKDRPRGTREQIAEAQKAVDALVHEYKMTTPTGNANEAWTARYRAAHLRLATLQGLPYSARTLRLFSREELAAARAKEGLA